MIAKNYVGDRRTLKIFLSTKMPRMAKMPKVPSYK
jgi:hypothetical protein